MGNYCIVNGCGRNYRKFKQLNYYTLPKERSRLIQWLNAAGRKDIIDKEASNAARLASYRLCSRHFSASSFKNKHLLPDAVPSLHLPGNTTEPVTEDEGLHEDIVCDQCTNPIVGFRYKCMTCPNYDLCGSCEAARGHAHHAMMRIPWQMKNVHIDKLVRKWRNLLDNEEISVLDSLKPDSEPSCDSSDDEPITKYASKNYDSGIDLSDDVKNTIREEVNRVLKLKNKNNNDRAGKVEPPSKRLKVETEFCINNNQKFESVIDESELPEVAFADVNDMCDQMESKMFMPEAVPSTSALSIPGPELTTVQEGSMLTPGAMPTMQVKLSEDMSELMIEVTANNQKTVYKYT